MGLGLLSLVVVAMVVAALRKYDQAPAPDEGAPTIARPTGTPVDQQVGNRVVVSRDPDRPLNLEFVGDLVEGAGLSITAEGRWTRTVLDALGAGGQVTWSVGNDGGDRLEEIQNELGLASDADLVIVAVGTHDPASGDQAVVGYNDRFKDLLRTVRSVTPGASVLCLGAWRLPDAAHTDDGMRESCSAINGVFVPLSDIYQVPANRGADGSPSAKGGASIAARALDAVEVHGG